MLEHLRNLIDATQFVGCPPTACSPGFTRIVHDTELQPVVFATMQQARSVVWLNGLNKSKRSAILKTVRLASHAVLIVTSYGIRTQLMPGSKWKRWEKVAVFSVGAKLMLSKNQYDFSPKASHRVLEVWANQAANRHRGVPDLGSYAVPTDFLTALYNMKGGRWDSFHEGSQDFKYRTVDSIVAATDGSVVKGSDGSIQMGGGIAFQTGSCDYANMHVHTHGHVSTFVAEGAAIHVLLTEVEHDTPLTILTDSANIMFALQHCSRREAWKNFSDHPDADLIQALAETLAHRTADTCFVKVKSHTSVLLNETADRLAAEAPYDNAAHHVLFEMQEDPDRLQYWTQGERDQPTLVQTQALINHFIQSLHKQILDSSSIIVQKLTATGVGRHFLHTVLWQDTGTYSMPDKAVKRMLQCLTNTFPTQSRLKLINKAPTAQCPFCPCAYESLFHWQQECPQFADARSKVHNDIWAEVYNAILPYASADFQCYKETPVGSTWLEVPTHLRRLQPNGIFCNKRSREWTLVDYTRSNGRTRADLKPSETLKQAHYADLLAALREKHASVEFYPLSSSYNGAVAEDVWRSFMTRIGIDDQDQDKILLTAVKAICIAFSSMVEIRYGSMAERRAQHDSPNSRSQNQPGCSHDASSRT